MTPAVYNFVEKAVLNHGLRAKPCLEIGSYDVNGSVQGLFTDYVGMDMRIGRNVQIQGMANRLPFGDKSFDVIVCVEMLEHDKDPFGSVAEMMRVLSPGGTLLLAVPGIGFPKHDYPSDYWRFTEDALKVLMVGLVVETSSDRDHVYGIGKKQEVNNEVK